jgi:hypothetical protein
MQARTLQEILQQIRQSYIDNFALREKYGLDPEETFEQQFSAVSLESIMTYIYAYSTWLYENVIAAAVSDLTAQIANEYLFSFAWYARKAREFQLGDTIVFDEPSGKFKYPALDESKQIVKFISIRQIVDGITKLRVYVCKSGKQALTDAELEAFKAYFYKIAAAGTHLEYVSQNPDQLDILLSVWRNPQIIDGGGNRLAGGGKPVEEAVQGYLDNIEYGGAFNRTKLMDAVQLAGGVNDVIIASVKMNGVARPEQSFEAPSGFYSIQSINISYYL